MNTIIDRLKSHFEIDSQDPSTRSLFVDTVKYIKELERLLELQSVIAADQDERVPSSPIKECIAHYEAEECDFSNLSKVANLSLIYVSRMEDSHVRCLLSTLAIHCASHPKDN